MSEIKFRPVRGKAETIKNLDYTDGYVYFTTDTGKIYLDVNDKRVAMGGNSGIFYGTMTPPEGADTDQVDFIFSFDEIEGDQVPNPDDLILNSDGCFYRVTNVIEDENTIETIKLTIAGSGTGGVVGPGGTTSRLTIKDIDNTLTKYFTTDVESAKLRFSVTSNITEDNFITSITYTIGNLDIVSDTEPKDFGVFEFDLTKYIPKMSTTVSTSVSIQVEDNYGTKKTINYRINVIELTLASSISDAILYTSTKQYDYYCTPRGGTTLQNRKLIFTIYDELGTELDQQTTNVSSTSEVKKTLDFSERAHGVYQFSVQYVGETADGLLIKSNILSYRLINYDTEVNTLLLTVAQPARTVEQYSVLEIPYMVADDPQSAVGENTVVLKLNGKETQQVIKNNVVQNWRLFFDTVGNYELSISVGSTEVVLDTITVVKYQGDMPTIDEEDENLMLLLKTTNRSNNDVNRDEWVYKNAKAELKDFYWGEINGWMVDEDNENMLRLTAGANLEVDNLYPFAKDAKESGLTIELDFKVSGVLDFSKPLIKCLSHNQDIIQTGFQVTGQESTMNSMEIKATGGEIREGDSAEDQVYNTAIQGLTTKFTEGERIHLTWVIERYDSTASSKPLVRTYLNGIMSGLTQYNSSDRFQENPNDKATISIDSTFADIDVYNIRVYSIALDQTAVLNNYIATSGTVDERVEIAADNNITYEDGKINPEKVFHEEYMLSVPYLKLVGGTSLNPKDKWAVSNETDENGDLIYRLPEAKKDYRLMSVEFVDPTGQRAGFKESIQLQNPSTGEIVTDAKDAKAGFRVVEGCQVYGQGTSSMEYPVKNLRIKFKEHEVELYPGAYPVDLICCKADYMESSSSHNTGTANLVDDLYASMGLKTPAQEFYNADNWGYDVVTAIKGFPIVIFWSADGEKFEYVGKYNFNMDKATHEPFGFVNYPEEYDENATSSLGWTEDGENAIHCFEFLNNASPLDNFLPETGKAFVPVSLTTEEYVADKYYTLKADEKTIDTAFIISSGDFDDKTQYYELFEDGSFNSTFYKMVYSDGEWVPNWFTCYESRFPEFDTPEETEISAWYRLCSWIASFGVDANGNIYDNKVAQFKSEFPNYFNENFTIFYYVLTHFLLMIDSRAKNMMMATWDNEHWYPIFYDMDTMLGLNNYGYNKFNYTAIDTEANLYNSQNSVLWKYVRAAFPTEIAEMYNTLRKSGLNYGTLTNNYNTLQADAWNEALYNADIYYKYIRPFSEGYYNSVTGDKIWVEPGEKNYLYAAQGRRSMHRQWWLNNRFNFFDGMYLSDQYKQDYFGMRLYTPSATDKYERDTSVSAETYEPGKYYIYDAESQTYVLSNDEFNAETAYYVEGSGIGVSAGVVPPNSDFHLTPLQDQFLSVAYGGENGQTVGPILTKANTTQTIKAAQTAFIDTETYVYGGSMLKDLGDLSPQYLGKFVFPNKSTKLEKLVIGNPHNDYYNPNFSELSIGSKAPYLEELNIMNCKGLKGRSVDIAQCRRIKKVLATGSGVSNIVLPEYGILEELRLPETATSVALIDHANLTNEKFTVGICDYNPTTKVYTYTNNFSNIQTLHIENTPINGYDIVMGSNKLLYVTLKGFNWTVTSNSLNNGKLETIDVLDKLIGKTPVEGNTTLAASISGNIHIAIPGASVNAIDIYNKYWEVFPNVTFTYDEDIMEEVIESLSITFLDGSGKAYWSRQIAEGGSITTDFLSGGPNGQFKEPVKASSVSHNYVFTGNWSADDGSIWSTTDIQNPEVFGTIQKSWTFTPIFDEKIKSFIVHYEFGMLNYSSGAVDTVTIDDPYNYGDIINFPKIIPYKDDSQLLDTETYTFKGWTLNPEKDIANSEDELKNMIVNTNNYIVAKNLSFTPVFMKENVHKAIAPVEYFNTYATAYTDINGMVYTGITIALNPVYTLQGKVTLPTTIGNDKVIGIAADAFKNCSLITHIFWEDGTTIKFLGTNSFSNMSSLRYFEMPSGVEKIEDFAFYYSRKLNPSEVSGPKLKYIGESAYNSVCMTNTDRNMIKIGGSVISLGTRAFAYNTNGYRAVQFGGVGEPSQLSSLGENAFAQNGTYPDLDWIECSIYTDDVTKDIWSQVDAEIGLTSSKIPA